MDKPLLALWLREIEEGWKCGDGDLIVKGCWQTVADRSDESHFRSRVFVDGGIQYQASVPVGQWVWIGRSSSRRTSESFGVLGCEGHSMKAGPISQFLNVQPLALNVSDSNRLRPG